MAMWRHYSKNREVSTLPCTL